MWSLTFGFGLTRHCLLVFCQGSVLRICMRTECGLLLLVKTSKAHCFVSCLISRVAVFSEGACLLFDCWRSCCLALMKIIILWQILIWKSLWTYRRNANPVKKSYRRQRPLPERQLEPKKLVEANTHLREWLEQQTKKTIGAVEDGNAFARLSSSPCKMDRRK